MFINLVCFLLLIFFCYIFATVYNTPNKIWWWELTLFIPFWYRNFSPTSQLNCFLLSFLSRSHSFSLQFTLENVLLIVHFEFLSLLFIFSFLVHMQTTHWSIFNWLQSYRFIWAWNLVCFAYASSTYVFICLPFGVYCIVFTKQLAQMRTALWSQLH